MSCDHDCDLPADFPRRIFNRPALPRIGYRIGSYRDLRAHMLRLLDEAPALAAWTHRGSDDPGIALLEATAVVGDILSLYQDDYANEAWLRTATLDDSVAGLVRLLGYRPAPGLGGRARFALAVKGTLPVKVPAGLGLDAPLEGAAKPASFETTAELLAVPALSAFHLYRPRRVPDLVNGQQTFQLDAADGLALKAGDRLMVGLQTGPAGQAAYDHLQVLEVDEVWEALGVQHVRTKGRLECLAGAPGQRPLMSLTPLFSATPAPLTSPLASPSTNPLPILTPLSLVSPPMRQVQAMNIATPLVQLVSALPAFSGVLMAGLAVPRLTSTARLTAWKLGGRYKHFGHAAPATRITVDADGRAAEQPVGYDRRLDAAQGDPAGPRLQALQLPLEGQLPELGAGGLVLVEANLSASAGGSAVKRVLSRRVRQIDGQSMAWGSQTGAATVLTLDADLALTEGGRTLNHADIRGITVHAVQGEPFTLRAAPVATSATQGSTLDFYGNAADAQALAGRTLLLMEPAGPRAARVQRVQPQPVGEPRFELTLDQALAYSLYGHDAPEVSVHGNLVDATEGKSEPESVLGDGDARQIFQTFALAKAPLTWLLDASVSPPRRAELTLRVDGLLWQPVDSFFDCGPRDRVYIVREGDDGQSFVQFGDGVHGARLPSGRGNVKACWRVGSGSRGALQAGASVSAKPRFNGFDQALLPEPVTGGAAPEPASSVRRAAPGSLQSLGRIVSLSDFESEAMSLPGVLKARAAWLLMDGAPVLCLTVLTDGLEHADRAALDAALRAAVQARGPARCALWLRLGHRRFARVGLRIGFDRQRSSADLDLAVRHALGVSEDETALDDEPTGGLFDWRERQFGQDVHGSQVVGRVQAVAGVAWVELLALAGPAAAGLTALAAGSATRPTANGIKVSGSALGKVVGDLFGGVTHTVGTSATLAARVALPAVQRRLVCPADSLLALHSDGLALDWAPVDLHTATTP